MSEKNEYDILVGNRITFYVFLPVLFLAIEIYKNGWGNIDYLGQIVASSASLIVLEGLNWCVIKFNMWLDAKREIKKANMRKL